MNTDKSLSNASLIVEFLKNPNNRINFDRFFHICFTKTFNYLQKLKNIGWTIPVHEADYHKNISDLTYDILGAFLRSKKDNPFFVIFEYFKRHRIMSFKNVNKDNTFDLFCILLWGFIKKELSQINNDDNLQIANLKRRIKEITDGEVYIKGKLEAVPAECVYLKKNKDNLRISMEPISKEKLVYLAQMALYDSKTRPEWCIKIFQMITEDESIQNYVSYSDLLHAVIIVNATQVEIDGNYSAQLLTPESHLIREIAVKAKEHAIKKIAFNDLKHFQDNGKITQNEFEAIMPAVDRYLTDYGYNSQTDSIRTYFRECMSEETHSRYFSDYKHIFDTIMNKARDYFNDYMKNNL